MIVRLPPDAVKSDGTKVPQEPGVGAKLGVGTYYFDVSIPDGPTSSIHMTWDAVLAATSINFQDSNLPAYKGAGGAATDKDSGADVAINDNANGNWVTQDPSTAYIPSGSGYTITNMTVAVTGGTANGTILDIGNVGSRRGRIKIVVTTGGFFRCYPHGKN